MRSSNLRKIRNGSIASLIFVVSVYITIIVGWILNIYQLVHMSGLTGYLVVKIIGIFLFPLGAVLGYIGLF